MKKRFRVATSGPTIDGREIKADWLKQAAANYDPANIYAARVNVEHLRSLSPNGDFGAYGDVTALSTETDKNGKTALYAEIEPNAKAIAANKAGQKVFASIEIIENFAGTGEAYLVGLALTDSPASPLTPFAPASLSLPSAKRRTPSVSAMQTQLKSISMMTSRKPVSRTCSPTCWKT